MTTTNAVNAVNAANTANTDTATATTNATTQLERLTLNPEPRPSWGWGYRLEPEQRPTLPEPRTDWRRPILAPPGNKWESCPPTNWHEPRSVPRPTPECHHDVWLQHLDHSHCTYYNCVHHPPYVSGYGSKEVE